jgi:hypothetical protein
MKEYKFAFVIDGEVAGVSQLFEGTPACEPMCAIWRSNPTIVEMDQSHPDFANMTKGWTFDGENWFPPVD